MEFIVELMDGCNSRCPESQRCTALCKFIRSWTLSQHRSQEGQCSILKPPLASALAGMRVHINQKLTKSAVKVSPPNYFKQETQIKPHNKMCYSISTSQ